MILLDTHVLVWSQFDERKLSRTALSTLRRGRNSGGLAISAISLIEIANMIERGKIETRSTIDGTISRCSEDGDRPSYHARDCKPNHPGLPPDFPRDPRLTSDHRRHRSRGRLAAGDRR